VKSTIAALNPVNSNASNVAWDNIIQSDAYKALPVDAAHAPTGYTGMTQADQKALFDFVQNNQITVQHDAQGNAVFVDSQGNILGSTGMTSSGTAGVASTMASDGSVTYPTTAQGQQLQKSDFATWQASNPNVTDANGQPITMAEWAKGGGKSYNVMSPAVAAAMQAVQSINSTTNGSAMSQLNSTVTSQLTALLASGTPTLVDPKNTTGANITTVDIGNGEQIQSLDNTIGIYFTTDPSAENANPAGIAAINTWDKTPPPTVVKFVANNQGKVVRIDNKYYQIAPNAQVSYKTVGGATVQYFQAYDSQGKLINLTISPKGIVPEPTTVAPVPVTPGRGQAGQSRSPRGF
jgi:hypothetical protein